MSGMPRMAMPPVGFVVNLPPAGAEGTGADGLRKEEGVCARDCAMAAI